MSSPRVSVVLPLLGRTADAAASRIAIERYLETTGFTFEVLPIDAREGEGYGAQLRRGLAEAKGSTIVVADADLPYPVSAIGDAVAMIDSGAADVVFGGTRGDDDPRHFLLRWWLVPILPDPAVRLKAFSGHAARLTIGESKLMGGGCDLELAFLANKYGFRVERLTVPRGSSTRTFSATSIASAIRIRLINRNMGYRAARRCPVCFSNEVWSRAQIPGNVVRACKRCKCRYLNQIAADEETGPVRRVIGAPLPDVGETFDDTHHSRNARDKTSVRRMALLRRQLTSGARLLEVGVRDGGFGSVAAREFEYVGIDPAQPAARGARAKGLEVYCATLGSFVNTGPAFDAIALFHVFENMADPHDALGRLTDLLKPGGLLFLTTFDTEGLLYLMTEQRRMAQNFRTHRILYSRSALIELLEHSGYEILTIGPDFEYRDHKFLRHRLMNRWPHRGRLIRALLRIVPDPLLVSSGSMRILAKRRAGPTVDVRAIRSVEPTHAR
ncbi:MAG TPA: bifunctional glycosyltransferase/class I SAM-dependent methyltransferase [Thermoanaerobaculia bacterium]|nr:bifunctional glycosyltransferase/class I SAM-dependent methyltransferase [Thermoanaerobaculia bacterium]